MQFHKLFPDYVRLCAWGNAFMFAYRPVHVPDFSPFYADAGLKPVKKEAATPTESADASTGAFSTPAAPSVCWGWQAECHPAPQEAAEPQEAEGS